MHRHTWLITVPRRKAWPEIQWCDTPSSPSKPGSCGCTAREISHQRLQWKKGRHPWGSLHLDDKRPPLAWFHLQWGEPLHWIQSSALLLTAEDLDASGVQVVLSPYQWPHANDQDVPKASYERHEPHWNPEHNAGKQVLKRGDAISIGLAGPDVRCEGAVLEFLEVAGRNKGADVPWEKDIVERMCIKVSNLHMGEVLHRLEHLCLNMWNLYSLQSTMEK